jgi:hypothetical protein
MPLGGPLSSYLPSSELFRDDCLRNYLDAMYTTFQVQIEWNSF